MPKITARLIDAIEPENKDIIIRDSELKGFICKITPKGKKIYMLYYRNKNGRERKPAIGIHGHITCYQAREIALNWLAEVSKGNDPSLEKALHKTQVTITNLADRYLEEYAKLHKKFSSIKGDITLLQHYVIPKLGKLTVNSLTRKDISDLHSSLSNKPIAANRCLALLSKMLNLAEKWNLRADSSSLCKHIDKYPENKREKFLSITEIERLSSALKEVSIYRTELPSVVAAIRLLLLTGCRLAEILTLKWEYIDIAHHRMGPSRNSKI